MPVNSEMSAAAASRADSVTVTWVTGAAAELNQISNRVLEPDRKPIGPLFQVLPAESVTDFTELVAPACTAIVATSVSPGGRGERRIETRSAVDGAGRVTNERCRDRAVAGGGDARWQRGWGPSAFPAASTARTVYW